MCLRLPSSSGHAPAVGGRVDRDSGAAGCGKPLFRYGDPEVNPPCGKPWLWNRNPQGHDIPGQVKTQQVTIPGFPQGWKRVSHSPGFDTKAHGDDYWTISQDGTTFVREAIRHSLTPLRRCHNKHSPKWYNFWGELLWLRSFQISLFDYFDNGMLGWSSCVVCGSLAF